MAIEFVSHSHHTGGGVVQVPRPESVQQGDFLIAFKWGGNTPTTPPSGWSVRADIDDPMTGDFLGAYWRVVENIGSEPATYGFTVAGSNAANITILAYRGVDSNAPFSATTDSYKELTSSASVTLPSVSVLEAGSTLIAAVMATAIRTPTPQGGLVQRSLVYPAIPAWTLATADQAGVAAGGTGTRTVNWGSSALSAGYLTALRPASGDPPGPTARPWTEAFIVE